MTAGNAIGTRRRWMLGGVALAATAAGVGGALWHERRRAPALAGDPWWQQPLPTPDGAALTPADLLGRPLLLNAWATWCPPCVREMPLLDRFHQAQEASRPGRGVRVFGLAIDGAAPVREFLLRSPVSYPVALGGPAGMQWLRVLGNTAGGLPFSVQFDADGAVLKTHIGELTENQLIDWAG